MGEWNQKYFLQFLLYVGILAVYSVALVAGSWYAKCEDCSKDIMVRRCKKSWTIYSIKSAFIFTDLQVRQSRVLHSVILVLESVLFGMFVIAIGCDQFEAIFTDETLVEQAKKSGPYR